MKTRKIRWIRLLCLLAAATLLCGLLPSCNARSTTAEAKEESGGGEDESPESAGREEEGSSFPALSEDKQSESEEEKVSYQCISQDEAKRLMDEGNCIVLDVREQSEYDEGHIENAVLLPYTEIDRRAEQVLPDKDALILVYCRSGRRSKIGAQSLADLGYTNVKEFGGIIDWQYGTVK